MSSRASGSRTAMDPRGRSPLPRRRGAEAGARSTAPTRDIGISMDGEPFLLPKPKRYPLRKPAPLAVEVAPADTLDAAEVKPKATTKKSVSSATNDGGSTTPSRLRRFRTPKSALKYTTAKQKPIGPSSPRGAGPQPQPDDEVSLVDLPVSADPPKTRRPLRHAQAAAGASRAGKRQRTMDQRAPLSDSSASVMAAPSKLLTNLVTSSSPFSPRRLWPPP